MRCELCNLTHDGVYGSGRFCSKKCARAFSTHRDRKVISKKISRTLSGKFERRQIDVDRLKELLPHITSWRQLGSQLGLGGSGSYLAILKRSMHEAAIDVAEATKHFKRRRTVNEILSIRPDEPKGHLRDALIRLGRDYVCEECNQGPTWNGKKLVLQVDHKNGISHDHRAENLRFLCPNCHTQTDTYSWRNVKTKREL